MHKRKFLLAFLMIAVLTLLAGCGNTRSAVAIDKFQKVCDTESMEEIDVTDFVSAYEGVTESYGGQQVGTSLKGIYMSMEDASAAETAYQTIYDSLSPDAAGTKISLDGDNFHSVTIDSDGSYTRVIQVENAIIYLEGTQTYKTEIDKIVSQFGSYPVSAI